MNLREDEISVQFSGGSDSTYTAALMAQRFRVVHLHTYRHFGIHFEHKCERNLSRLRKAFGEEKFTHRYLSVNELFKSIYFKDIVSDFHNYGNYLVSCSCAACKLAMHLATIDYNLQHGIRYVCDGSQRELASLFPEQMPGVLEAFADLYTSFGIIYTNPVYDTERTDWHLYDMGITPKRDYKNEHVYYSVQHSCIVGVAIYIYILGFNIPFFGLQSDETTAIRYTRNKMEVFRDLAAKGASGVEQLSIQVNKTRGHRSSADINQS